MSAAATKTDKAPEKRNLTPLERLAWLADVPLFIDEERVTRFYDAAVRPEYERGKVTREIAEDSVKKVKAVLGIEGGVKAKLPAFLNFFVGAVEGEVKAKAGGEGAIEAGNSTGLKTELIAVNSPERKLEELGAFDPTGLLT